MSVETKNKMEEVIPSRGKLIVTLCDSKVKEGGIKRVTKHSNKKEIIKGSIGIKCQNELYDKSISEVI